MDEQSSPSHVPPGAPQASKATPGAVLTSQHVTPAEPHGVDASAPHKKRRHLWIWVVVLLVFAGIFYWVIQHQQKSQAAAGGGGGRRGALGGPVPVTIATAQKGSMGIYFDAL